ncbi:MAG: serine/threonine-protein kinase [Tahibacter sp.]
MSPTLSSLRDWFEAALAQPGAQRAAFLDRHCTDPQLRSRVVALLVADADAAEPLAGAELMQLAQAIGDSEAEPVPPLPAGSVIGPFTLVRVLGEGGSSTVFQAQREIEGATQEVALKLLRRGLHSPEAQRLFRREQRALIQLRHPNIARMIEGGVTESGLPYIALELVSGASITEHVERHRLDLPQRLRLFGVVCAAVDAAHRALIVHRDLKPSNVLVTDEGEVKLLDFGVAKLLDDDEGVYTLMPAFTPAYAAPEQRDGGPITTATDVYALGVLLGELLTGERLRGQDGRLSSQPDPPLRAATATTAQPTTRRALRGDLAAIVAKAVDADAPRRYASAGALAEDIERLLAGRPVSAQKPSRWYRARKFVTRHQGAVASTGVFLLAVFAALGMALWQARVAREQEHLARNESHRANAIRAFVVELLKTASADLPKDQRPTPEALISTAATQAREDPALDPAVRAQLLLTLGEIARANGDNANAEVLIDEAIQRDRELQVPLSSTEWIGALVAKGNLLHSTNRSAAADRLMQELLPALETSDSEESVSALMLYGVTRAYAGDADRAIEISLKALHKAQRVFGADSTNGIETATFLGQICSNLHRYRESAAILDEATTRWRRLQLPLDEQFARSLFHLAVARQHLGERGTVEPLFKEGIALMRRVHEGPYYRLAQGLVGYARFLIESERFEDAQVALDEALAAERTLLGVEHVRVATSLDLQGVLHSARQELVAAEASTRRGYDVLLRHAKEAGYEPELARARLHLASNLLALGRPEDALPLQAQAAIDLPVHFGANSAEVAEAVRVGGQVELARHHADAALAAADRAISLVATLDIPAPGVEIASRALRANALLALQRTTEAHSEIQRALDVQLATNASAHVSLSALLASRARIERAVGDEAAAIATVAQARDLAVPIGLLSVEDGATLHPPGS